MCSISEKPFKQKRPQLATIKGLPSGSVMTFMASSVKRGTLNCLAAASAFDIVGFDIITGVIPGAFVSASKCTNPIRPIPIEFMKDDNLKSYDRRKRRHSS
jgi:hypothetical protein